MSAASFIGWPERSTSMVTRASPSSSAGPGVLPGGAAPRALSAQVRAVYHSGFSRRRYGGNLAASSEPWCILASFVYVVAQIYGIGLITSRLVGVEFEVGFSSPRRHTVCSFLGGMRAVTWTQVAQYIVLIIAYMLPVAILAQKVTGASAATDLRYRSGELGQGEGALRQPEGDRGAGFYKARADDLEAKLQSLPASLTVERQRLSARVEALRE